MLLHWTAGMQLRRGTAEDGKDGKSQEQIQALEAEISRLQEQMGGSLGRLMSEMAVGKIGILGPRKLDWQSFWGMRCCNA